MSTSDDDVAVFADRLEAAGDPRGPLLALELAAARAEQPSEARRLAVEAQKIRRRHPELAWPPCLRETDVRLRAGFPVTGAFADFDAPDVAAALMLSLRSVRIEAGMLEPAIDALARLGSAGLRLESVSESYVSGRRAVSNLGCFARLADSTEPTLRSLSLWSRTTNIEALARLPGLTRLSVHEVLTQAQLCSLAPLALEELSYDNREVAPVLVPLFGNTLASLRLGMSFDEDAEATYSDAHLDAALSLPWLRSLSLNQRCTHEQLERLAELPRLDSVFIRRLDAENFDRIARLRLRELVAWEVAPELSERLDRLTSVEELALFEVPEGFDVTRLSGLPSLRSLDLPDGCVGSIALPETIEHVSLGDESEVRLFGQPPSLSIAATLRVEPSPSLLAGLRSLVVAGVDDRSNALLDDLARRCPNLESLRISPSRREGERQWVWPAGPRQLESLTRLRSFVLGDTTTGEQAELAEVLPSVCVLGPGGPANSGLWPVAGEPHGSRITVTAPTTTSRSTPTAPAIARGFDQVQARASALQAAGDPRGELLALELAAELAKDVDEARRWNLEAERYRRWHRELAWPQPLRGRSSGLRAGLPVTATGAWFEQRDLPMALLASVRTVDISDLRSLEYALPGLTAARVAGLQLDSLRHAYVGHDWPLALRSLGPFVASRPGPVVRVLELGERPAQDDLAPLREIRGLESLCLCGTVSIAQLQSMPELKLRALAIERGHGIEAWLAGLEGTIEHLRLGHCGRIYGNLPSERLPVLPDGVRTLILQGQWARAGLPDVLPRLEQLECSIREPEALHRLSTLTSLRGLRVRLSTAFVGEALWLAHHLRLESLTIESGGTVSGDAARRLRRELGLIADMCALEELDLDVDLIHELGARLALPGGLTALSLRRRPGAREAIAAIEVTGAVRRLRTVDVPIAVIPTSLLERAASLNIELAPGDSLYTVVTHVTQHCPELETLTLSGADVTHTLNWALSELGGLQRLRELTIVGATVEQLAAASALLPSVRVFGQALASRDPRTWPIAQPT